MARVPASMPHEFACSSRARHAPTIALASRLMIRQIRACAIQLRTHSCSASAMLPFHAVSNEPLGLMAVIASTMARE